MLTSLQRKDDMFAAAAQAILSIEVLTLDDRQSLSLTHVTCFAV